MFTLENSLIAINLVVLFLYEGSSLVHTFGFARDDLPSTAF